MRKGAASIEAGVTPVSGKNDSFSCSTFLVFRCVLGSLYPCLSYVVL